METVTHAFITSWLDYCNSLYMGLTHSTLSRLQMVQNAAARLLTGTKKRYHITSVLAHLHWLPVKYRIDFKILLHNTLLICSFHILLPGYLGHPHNNSSQSLTHASKCNVTGLGHIGSGSHTFSVAGPRQSPFSLSLLCIICIIVLLYYLVESMWSVCD